MQSAESQSETPQRSLRLQALDALRGLTVALMILVNTSGDGAHTYCLLRHSPWNGCTIADVVFPCFLFMVGVSLVFAMGGKLRRGEARGAIVRVALRRAAVLFLLGMVVNGFPLFLLQTLRVFGVLQRIAVCFFLATVVYFWLKPRGIATLTVAILVGYAVLLRWVPVPGYGMPVRDVPLLDPHGNWPAWLDRHLLPANHLYHRGFYDPEGLLGSVAALASTLLGVLTGVVLQRKGSAAQKARTLLIAGVVGMAIGLGWNHWLPWNKRLWTSSFVMWNAGISLLALSMCMWWLDVLRRGTRVAYPMLVFGTNALAAYAFSELLQSLLGAVRVAGISLQQWLFRPIAAVIPDRYVAALVYAVLYTVLCFLPVWLLYRRRIFLKV